MKTKKTYYELLQDPRWQKIRLEILERDNFTCVNCGDKENSLHVHHRAYLKDMMPWEYEDKYLKTVCDECHDIEHYYIDKNTTAFLVSGYPDTFISEIRNALDFHDDKDKRDSFQAALTEFLNNKEMMNLAIGISNAKLDLNHEISYLKHKLNKK